MTGIVDDQDTVAAYRGILDGSVQSEILAAIRPREGDPPFDTEPIERVAHFLARPVGSGIIHDEAPAPPDHKAHVQGASTLRLSMSIRFRALAGSAGPTARSSRIRRYVDADVLGPDSVFLRTQNESRRARRPEGEQATWSHDLGTRRSPGGRSTPEPGRHLSQVDARRSSLSDTRARRVRPDSSGGHRRQVSDQARVVRRGARP
jgi:hypothetical protein